MLAYTYIEHGKFGLLEKPIPVLEDARDAIVRVTPWVVCTQTLSSLVLHQFLPTWK